MHTHFLLADENRGYFKIPQENINVWGGRRENRTLQVAFLSRNRSITFTTLVVVPQKGAVTQQLFNLSLSLLKLCTSVSQCTLSRELLEHRKVRFLKAQRFESMLRKEKQFDSQGVTSQPQESPNLHSLIDTRQNPDPQTNLQFRDPLNISYRNFRLSALKHYTSDRDPMRRSHVPGNKLQNQRAVKLLLSP